MYACAWGVSRTDHMLVVYFQPLVAAKAHQTVIMSCLWGVRGPVSTMAGAIWDVTEHQSRTGTRRTVLRLASVHNHSAQFVRGGG